MRVHSPERVAARIHRPNRDGFQTHRYKTRARQKGIRQLGELAGGVVGIDAIDGTDRGDVAIGKIIRSEGSSRIGSLRRGGASARTQDQHVMRQWN